MRLNLGWSNYYKNFIFSITTSVLNFEHLAQGRADQVRKLLQAGPNILSRRAGRTPKNYWELK